MTQRSALLLRGSTGWGEFSPFPDYSPAAAGLWFRAAREAADEAWPQPLRAVVPVNATVPAVEPATAHRIVTESGCATAKVKAGDAADEARIAAVRDALGPAGRLRIDVNAAWERDEAVRRIRALARYDLEYVEQPVASVEDMAAVRKRVDVPLAADESLRSGAAGHVIEEEAADIAVLKVHPLGGVRRCLLLADRLGLPVVVSSALETSIGLAAGVALAAALPELPYACGLGTASLLVGDLVAEPLVPVDGYVHVRRPEPDASRLARFRLTGTEEEELRAALTRAASAVGAR